MITRVNTRLLCGLLLSLYVLTGSVNHSAKLALWLGFSDAKSAIAGFYQFPRAFNNSLSSFPQPIVKALALNGFANAQFNWALVLLRQSHADKAKLFWQLSVTQQPANKREQLAQLLVKQKRWAELELLAKQGLIPISDALETLKLHLSYPKESISSEFAKRTGIALFTHSQVAEQRCSYNVLMLSNHLEGLTKLNAFKQKHLLSPQPASNSFCFSTPVYLGDSIECQSNPLKAANCHWQPLINKVQWPRDFDFIVMMPRNGKGNVRSGIMQLGSQSHYGLFLHELMHFDGFEDEYALPTAKQAWLCKQTGYVAPNLFIANGISPPQGWHLSQSCQGKIKAYKPSKNWSIMQYQQVALSTQYKVLWSKQIKSKDNQPLRFVDYFSKLSETVNIIDKMTNNHISE